MGLFDKLFKKEDKPTVVAADNGNVALAPVSGEAVALENVGDPVFECGALGKGLGIKPSEGVIYSPVTGTVTALATTLHALGLDADNGAEVLVHVGIDTVEMRGDGFEGFVKQGDHVVAGQKLLTFDRQKIAEAGHPDMVIMSLTNTDDLASVDPAAPGAIKAGAVAISFSK